MVTTRNSFVGLSNNGLLGFCVTRQVKLFDRLSQTLVIESFILSWQAFRQWLVQ